MPSALRELVLLKNRLSAPMTISVNTLTLGSFQLSFYVLFVRINSHLLDLELFLLLDSQRGYRLNGNVFEIVPFGVLV